MTRVFGLGHAELRQQRKSAARWIGRKVHDRRSRLHLTQKEVAGDVFTAAYISALERGLAAPSLASLIHLSAVLKVRPAYFLEGMEWINR